MATSKLAQRCALLSLPTEVLLNIVDFIAEDPPSEYLREQALRRFGDTCKLARSLVERALCQNLKLLLAEHCNTPFLDAHQYRRHFVKHLIIGNATGRPDDAAAIAECIPRYPAIEYLYLSADFITSDRRAAHKPPLLSYLNPTNLSRLCKCDLDYHQLTHKVPHSQLAEILKAPRLAELSIDGADLRGFHQSCLPHDRPALKRLRLRIGACDVDEQAISAILSTLAVSGTLELDTRWDFPPKLLLHLEDAVVLWDEKYRDIFDMQRLEGLKILKVITTKLYRDVPTVWCPINALAKLPDGIQQVTFECDYHGPDLELLANKLASNAVHDNLLPASLKRLNFVFKAGWDWVEGAPAEEDQLVVDRRLRGIDLIKARSSLQQLSYTPDPEF
ncbi:hypothetical protein H2200_012396 [Cladophialophora chaetospira]|uniref:Uncharacterized protein n=1 Tax=Cladophialophora chaetospira TaxID=386627 RepID=A0AA38WXR1_9EURO|nr:hypothetical protein H2200_012396 [Cladophialophora chaetospira]